MFEKLTLGYRRIRIVTSTHVVEAANLSGAARCEHGMLARATGCRANRIFESRKSAAAIEDSATETIIQ
jgi:hypothetical protein